MYVISTTIAATSPTSIVPRDPIVQHESSFQWVTFYNNSAAVMYIGDSRVSASLGIPLQPSGSFTVQTPVGYTETLGDWYVTGTAGQTLLTFVVK